MTAGLRVSQDTPHRASGPQETLSKGQMVGLAILNASCAKALTPPRPERHIQPPGASLHAVSHPEVPDLRRPHALSDPQQGRQLISHLPAHLPHSSQGLGLPTTLLHPLHGLRPPCGLSWLQGGGGQHPLPRPHHVGEQASQGQNPWWILRRPGSWNQCSPRL